MVIEGRAKTLRLALLSTGVNSAFNFVAQERHITNAL